jgi:hypothetical protein
MATRRNLEAKLARLLAHPSTDVLWYHRVGRCLLALKGITDYKAHCVRTAARTAKQHRSTFYRAMLVAKSYSERDIQALRHFSWTALRALAMVQDKKLRRKLQRKAKEQRWPVRRIQWEIFQCCGKKAPRGGWKRQPGDESRDLMSLATATREWRGFVNDVWPSDRLSKLRRGGKKLATLVECAVEAMNALLKAVESRALPDQKSPSPEP